MLSLIMRSCLSVFIAALGASLPNNQASAQTAPRGAAVPESGLYVWIDGSYRSVNLPTLGLGLIDIVNGTGFFGGQIQRYNPRADGYGVQGGFGFAMPDGTLPAAFGSRVRLEFDAQIVDADASQAASTPTASGIVNVRMLDGRGILSIGCAGCPVAGTLQTDYSAQRFTGKIASDYLVGSVRLTPSLAIFAGMADTGQVLSQNLIGVPAFQPTNYRSTTTVKWNDLGAKAGLAAQVDLAGWITPGIAGTIGFASRDASLDGSDHGQIAGLPGSGTQTRISVDRDTTALLASGEVSLEMRPANALKLRLFAGVEYDDSVPGISSPSFTGATAGPPTSTTAAGLTFSSQTSFYAGGSLRLSFPPR